MNHLSVFRIDSGLIMTDGFVFLDTETTGMEDNARVIDIALVQTSSNGEIEKVYDSLIHGDGSSGGSRLVAIHQITNEMIKNARRFEEVWVEIEPLLRNRIIVAHNEQFDRKHINYELAQIGVKPLDGFLCSLKLARFLGLATRKTKTSNGSSGKLEALADRFGFKIESAHRALPDTKALVKVFWKMKEHYPDEVNEFIAHHQSIAVGHLKPLGSVSSSNLPRTMVKEFNKSDEHEKAEDDESKFDVTTEVQSFNRLDLSSKDLSNQNLNRALFCQILGTGANFSGSSLENCYFSQAYLEDAMFQGVRAFKADFGRADLTDANFSDANLEGANFQFSDLTGADFTGANLEGASFGWANLRRTNLTNANLTSANFHNAFIGESIFLNAIVQDCDLPKGLHTYDFTDIDFTNVRYKRHWESHFPNANFTRSNLRDLNLECTHFISANFVNADLSGVNLSEANLSAANFTGANLARANLSGADLSGTNFTGANLTDADLSYADFHETKFINAHCYQTTFSIDHSRFGENHRPDFTGANLFNSDFSGSYHLSAIMTNANLCNANFREATISDTDFSGAELTGANFSSTELKNVTISILQLSAAELNCTVIDRNTFLNNGIKKGDLDIIGTELWCDFSENWLELIEAPSDFNEFYAAQEFTFAGDFAGWDFSNIDLHGNSLQGSNLVGCDFSSTDLSSADLGATDCTKSTFFRAKLVGTSFENANLSKCSFEKATIYDVDFTGADLSEANLSNLDLTAMEFSEVDFFKANLVAVDFSNCNLSDCCFIGANLDGARFVGADLTNSDFSNATLTNCIFQNANLANVNFAGSNLSSANLLDTNINTRKLKFAKLFNSFMPDGTVSQA